MDRIQQSFTSILILTRSCINLWPMNHVRFFLCSLSRELNNGELNNGNRQNFAYALMLTKSRLTICNIYKTVMTLVLCQRLFSTNSGLQIRGGKGYFSIDFCGIQH